MKRFVLALLCLSILKWCAACNGSSTPAPTGPITVNITNPFQTIEAGNPPVVLAATVTGDPGNPGLTWTLSQAGAACSPGCGALKAAPAPSLSAVYTPPAAPPLNQSATITARSVANSLQVFVFNFQIVPAISVSVSPKFTSVNVGGAVQNLTATITNDPSNSGVNWALTAGGAACSPGCGVLTSAATPSLTAQYQPPAVPPSAANASATITVASVKDSTKTDSFNFNIVTPPISVTITNKFQSANTGGASITLNGTITNDFLNQGLNWSLTEGGTNCSPGCGTLTPAAAPALSAQYQPPSTPPASGSSSPTITATSVADNTKSDSFNFNIVTPAISVTILNKFQSIFTGTQPVTVNASISNDFLNQGIAWSMTNGGAACTAACGTLTPIGSPSTSATYTPPASPQTGPTPSPTIVATAVSDNTKTDSFQFSLVIPNSLVTGNYAVLLRGYDQALQPEAFAGILTADGMGNITGGEYDLNDNTTVTNVPGPLSGTYTVDVSSFSNIPRVTFNFGNTVLKCALSSDGKKGKVIELDGSLALNAGTLLRQDSTGITALSGSTAPTRFAFGLDSDAPVNARVVEAGQFILGAGATSVTGGIADEGQASAANPIFGGVAGAASIAPASSAATAPNALGRGTLTLSIGGSATQYAYYVVSSSRLNLIEIDAGGALKTVQAGIARNQSALTANSINATSVAALTGMTAGTTTPSPDVIIGVLTNASGAAPVANFDSNNAGTVATLQTATGSFAVPYAPTTGRSVIAGTFMPDAVLYLYDTGSGFLADVTPSANGVNHGISGSLVPQTVPAGGFTLQSLSGNSIGLAGGSSTSSMANLDFAANYDGVGDFSAELDFTSPNPGIGQGTNFMMNTNTCPCTYQIDNPNLGHGTLGVISSFFNNVPNQSDSVSFYLIGLNQLVAIENLGLSPSDILFFDPQFPTP